VAATILRLMGRDPDDFDHVTDRAGTTCGMLSTLSPVVQSWAGVQSTPHTELSVRRPALPPRLYRDNESCGPIRSGRGRLPGAVGLGPVTARERASSGVW